MVKAQHCRMQAKTLMRVWITIKDIPQNRVPEVLHMQSQLMRSPRLWGEFNAGRSLGAFHDPPVRYGFATVRIKVAKRALM